MSGDSLALVARDGSTARQSDVFNQQGTIEWTNIANFTVTSSVALLSRLASAGLEPLTLAVGQAVCSPLSLGPIGERRLQESLNSLKSFSSFGDVIWFGLGVRHALRTLVQTAQGASCVALTASLAEVHSVDVAALVLYNLTKIQNAPVELSPSFAQWQALAKTCASVFKTSSFSLRVQTLLSMMDKEPGMAPDSEVCDSANLAEVLHAIALVKSGEKRGITLVGGADCAWVIAFADWLLTLRVQLRGHNGDLLYANFDGPDHQVQISAQYAREGSIDSKSLRKTGESYCLRSGRDIIFEQLGLHNLGFTELGGGTFPSTSIIAKVQWTEALSTAFGEEVVRSMMQHGATIHSLMTRAQQILQQSHEGLRYESFGLRSPMIENVIKWFPELKPLQDLGKLDDDLEATPTDPYKGYASSLEDLAHHCGCHQCTVTPSSPLTVKINLRNDRWRVCLVSLTEMIISLCHYLAQTVLDSALYPTVVGLREIYRLRKDGRKVESPERSEELQANVEEDRLRDSFYYHAFENKNPLDKILFLLYTGDVPEYKATRSQIRTSIGRIEEVCASSWHGICCYAEVLVALSDQYGHASMVHVTAGVIEANGRTWDTIHGHGESLSDYPGALPLDESNASRFDNIKQSTPELKVEVVVNDINILAVSYKIFDENGSVWVNPVEHLFHLRQAAQDLLNLHLEDTSCVGHNQTESRSSIAADPKDHYLAQGIGDVLDPGEHRKWLYRPLLTMLSRCAALKNTLGAAHRMIIVGDKCLLCIMQAIVERGGLTPEDLSRRVFDRMTDTAFILDSLDHFPRTNKTRIQVSGLRGLEEPT
ncbi:MAG: hypothetical protein LQ347_002980 [Umbilicaria vellea]|nr:MAG: hypothetical protein LQ347_002980 [Umbilicaria vellea]